MTKKKASILAAWNGFKIEQRRQFPSLAPTSIGNEYAGITGGRVLNVKHSTAPSRPSRPSAGSSSRAVVGSRLWDRVDRAATNAAPNGSAQERPSTTTAFPTLGSGSGSGSNTPSHRGAGTSATPWASSNHAAQVSQHLIIAPRPPVAPEANKGKGPAARPPPTHSTAQFPGLPSSFKTPVPRVAGNQTLRKLRGDSAIPENKWGGAGGDTSAAPNNFNAEEGDNVGNGSNGAGGGGNGNGGGGGGGKGKKKQKQTLFTLGSFPT